MAYVQAVVASAGAYYLPYKPPEYGLDCNIMPVTIMSDGSYNYTGHFLQCQVKSTTDWIERGDFLLYDLDAEAYNKLVKLEGKTAILIVFKLPKNVDEWLVCTENCLELRHCCYWIFLEGDPTPNTSSKRVSIPRNQIFDPNA
ncbi:MAG: DUF4365 domain-containing protein, partial [Chloroflexi bacterium]|nr:DUF4365 domain-containing protein [Chloroflexota bacterium]